MELLSGGVNMPVTPLNVYEYVRKYAEHRMLVVAEQPLHVSKILIEMLLHFNWMQILRYLVFYKLHLKVCQFFRSRTNLLPVTLNVCSHQF